MRFAFLSSFFFVPLLFCALFSLRYNFFTLFFLHISLLRSFFCPLLLFSSCFCFFCALFSSSYHFFLRIFAVLHSFFFFHSVALVLFFCALRFFWLFFLHAFAFLLLFFCTLFSLFFSLFRALFLRCFFFALSRSFFNSGIYRKTATPCLMTSLAYIQDQVPREKYFLQGPCFYGQRRLCLALCILSSLYGQPAVLSCGQTYLSLPEFVISNGPTALNNI